MKTRQEKFGVLMAQFTKAEDVHVRAMKKYMKLRDAVRRAEKRLDKEAGERHSQIAGELDIREITPPTKPEILTPKLERPATAGTVPPTPASHSPRRKRRANPPPSLSQGGI